MGRTCKHEKLLRLQMYRRRAGEAKADAVGRTRHDPSGDMHLILDMLVRVRIQGLTRWSITARPAVDQPERRRGRRPLEQWAADRVSPNAMGGHA